MTNESDAPIPAVCFVEDVARALAVSRRTIDRLRRHRAFPIPELAKLDDRPRWSGADVRAFRDRQLQTPRKGRA